jgi:hypothetical protein
VVLLVIVVETEQLRRKSPVPAAYGETEHPHGQPELRTQRAEDDRFPKAIRDTQPHHGEV